MKKILLPLLIVLGTSVNAQSVNSSSNIKVSAQAVAGCKLSGDNANFSDVLAGARANMDLRIQCSKTTPVILTVSSGVNPNNIHGQFMSIGGAVVNNVSLNSPEALQYFVHTNEVKNNAKYTITRRPKDESLFVYINGTYDYRLMLTLHTSEEVVLPLRAQITGDNVFMKLIPGDYSDNATYHLTF